MAAPFSPVPSLPDSEPSKPKGARPLDSNVITGIKYLTRLYSLMDSLAAAGCERDTAGNRRLHYSQYAGLILMGLFNPTLQSLQGLSEASELRRVQKAVGGPRVSVGALSESVRVFDPALLEPIFQDLFSQLPEKLPQQTNTDPSNHTPSVIPVELIHKLSAADGTALRALPQIVGAVGSPRGAKWRLHVQFEVHREIPEFATLTPDETGGEDDERNVLARNLRTERLYLLDRGYERYKLFTAISAAGSDYICRVQQRNVTVTKVLELTPAARDARVISDELVTLPGVSHPVRRITIQKPAQGRQRTDKPNSDKIVLMTNLLDVPAEVIAALYELRWSIELFFRFFKHVLGCRHLLSHKPEGIMIQVYCALIAALLMSLTLGESIGIRGYELICLFLQGWAEEDELLAGLRRLAAKKQKKQ